MLSASALADGDGRLTGLRFIMKTNSKNCPILDLLAIVGCHKQFYRSSIIPDANNETYRIVVDDNQFDSYRLSRAVLQELRFITTSIKAEDCNISNSDSIGPLITSATF